MKHVLLISLFACASALLAQTAPSQEAEARELLETVRALTGHSSPVDSLTSPSDTLRARPTIINLAHFYRSSAPDSFALSPSHQTVLEAERQIKMFKTGFQIGGALYANNDKLDRRRSGLRFGFDRNEFIEQLKNDNLPALSAAKGAHFDQLRSHSKRIAGASDAVLFEDYLKTINSPAYQEMYRTSMQATDSLLNKPARKLDASQQNMLARRHALEDFSATYRSLLQKASALPAELRRNAHHVIDSCRGLVAVNEEELFRRQLLRSPKLSTASKLLLMTRRFAVGNTRMGTEETTSVGLPIRGLNYAFDDGWLAFEVQHGKRILSDRFLPQDGLVFHDRQRPMRLSRLAATIRAGKESRYQVSALFSQELPNQENNLLFPRSNQVFGAATETRLSENIAVLADLYSSSVTTENSQIPVPGASETLGNLAGRIALQMAGKKGKLSVGVFRRGATFTSFANPYLFTDYEGLETKAFVSLWNNRLTGDFQITLGRGTQSLTRSNVRVQARGQVFARIGRTTSITASAAPNVFRYTVTNTDGFSEANLYRLDLHQRGKVGGRDYHTTLSVTNLNQGFAWSDTTRTTESLIARISLGVGLGETSSLAFDAQRNLQPQEGTEWLHALSLTSERSIRWSFGIRYDKYRGEKRGAPGATLDLGFSLSRHLNANFNLYFRAADDPAYSEYTGQQFWRANL